MIKLNVKYEFEGLPEGFSPSYLLKDDAGCLILVATSEKQELPRVYTKEVGFDFEEEFVNAYVNNTDEHSLDLHTGEFEAILFLPQGNNKTARLETAITYPLEILLPLNNP